MQKSKTLSKALTGILVGGMLLSFGGAALAAGDANDAGAIINAGTSVNAGKLPFVKQMVGGIGGMLQHKGSFAGRGSEEFLINLDGLVKDGTITQAKVDEIKAYLDQKAKEKVALREEMQKLSQAERKALMEKKLAEKAVTAPEKKGLLGELVENKILTQEQADTIQAKLKAAAAAQRKQQVADGLKALVEKGTLTQAQADKVAAKLEAVQKEREALFEKTKDMTQEERRQYMEQNKTQFQNPLSQLVADGTITQEQAKALRGITSGPKGHKDGFKDGSKDGFRKGFKAGFKDGFKAGVVPPQA